MTQTQLAPERIVAAANYWPEMGILIIGIRHWSPDMRVQAKLYQDILGERLPVQHEQGFVDQFGKFYSREEAWDIAVANNQIFRKIDGDEGTLFSENLY